jgi:hypothetical protein|tara:strand:- start:1352 stop:1843 length:492 start_codon:yes stop_codon:yes gene_type:complete
VKYIGNHNFIQDEWLIELLNTEGQARPRDWPPAYAVESAEYARAEEAGYNLNAVNWWVYESQNVTFDLIPPWVTDDYHWWITKLYPGQFMPMHTDPHTHERDCKRYWVPLQDYHPGHIFMYNNSVINNYNKGDVFEYAHAQDIHGAANIGHIPRLVLQVTEYK